jgi:hypothetical protein
MSSPIPPPPAGSQPAYVPPSEGQQNPYAAAESGPVTGQAYGQPASYGQAAPYGQATYQPAPGQPYGTPGQPFPGGRPPSNGLAVAALVVGVISLLLAWIPVVNIVSILGGIAALVLGVVALRRAKQGTGGGKGMAIGGTVLGGVSLVAAIVVNVVVGIAVDDAIKSVESAAPSAAPVQPADDEQPASTQQPVDAQEPAAASGELLALGEAGEVGDYTITVTGLNLDANQAIAEASASNPAPSGQYVMADISVVYNGSEEGNAWMDLSYILAGSDSNEYDDGTCMAIEPNSVVNTPALAAGDSADYQVCLDVPAEAIEGGTFSVEPLFSFDASDRATWAIN